MISNSSSLCPTSDCKFNFVHDDYDGFNVAGVDQRNLDGTLKVSKDGKSKIYTVSGNFQVTEEEEKAGNSVKETLQGTLEISGGGQPSSHEYQTNGTLTWKDDKKSGDLALQGHP